MCLWHVICPTSPTRKTTINYLKYKKDERKKVFNP